ncbi:hypothetical protein DPMN_038019 [Dreissena polymorpha]|uniref:Uncharacterized protein n=1 Tax=Dreissena polymorpha TaxID=45954 RepID=A0A9D4MGB9_DREPO|nr:hypothetical protein DPMN_038019 [Dreissena polymorpha]
MFPMGTILTAQVNQSGGSGETQAHLNFAVGDWGVLKTHIIDTLFPTVRCLKPHHMIVSK